MCIEFVVGKFIIMVVYFKDGEFYKVEFQYIFNEFQIEWFKNGSVFNIMVKVIK